MEERIDEQLFGSKWVSELAPGDIFWELVGNMGLLKYADNFFDDRIVGVDTILTNFLDRKYDKDGKGGNIFHIPNYNEKDLRKIELWSQMMIYCRWRWPI
jgi:hypothetical protein